MTRDAKTIILGYTGFIGRSLYGHLQAAGVAVQGYSSQTLDLRHRDALATLDHVIGPDVTLIIASALTPDKGVTLDRLSDNLAMTINVARYLETHPVRKCVYLSSDAVYSMSTNPVTESTPAEPTNFYALAKYTGERVLQSVADAKGFPLLMLRPTGVYGPGDTHNSYGPNRFIHTIVAEKTVRLFGQGEETRDHLYIDDLVRITSQLAALEWTGVFNVATGISRTFASIMADLRAIVPYEFGVINLPRQGPITHRQFDITRLSTALPEFRFTEFTQGLQATFTAVGGPG